MKEWSPESPAEVFDENIEARLLDIANDAAVDIYAKHDSSRQTNRFTLNGVLLPKFTIIESAGLLDDCALEQPFDRHLLQDSLAIMGADVASVQEEFAESNIDIMPVLSGSLEIGEGTENNLPWYHAKQFVTFQSYEALVEMLGGWTSEEATHGELVELVMIAAGLYNEKKSVHIQTELMRGGIGVTTMSLAAINAYTDPQERLTFVAHQSSAMLAGESGSKALIKLAGQENRHKTMFRGLGKAMYDTQDPEIVDYLLRMDAAVMAEFEMPGQQSFPKYEDIAKLLANTGLFTFNHVIESFAERAKKIGIAKLEPTSEEAKNAQQWILDYIQPQSELHSRERKFQGILRKRYDKSVRSKGKIPFIVGETVELEKTAFKPAA